MVCGSRFRWCGLATVAAWACEPAGPYFGRTTPRHGPEEIWIGNGEEPQSIDPGISSGGAGGTLIANVFAGLVQLHPRSLEPQPDIAHAWDVSTDGRIYTFYLRPSLWSDGHPLTAEDFAFAFRRVLNPATGSRRARHFSVLQNAQAFTARAIQVGGSGTDESLNAALAPFLVTQIRKDSAGLRYVFVAADAPTGTRDAAIEAIRRAGFTADVTPAESVGIRVVDPLTLELTLENPIGYLLPLLASHTARPVPRHRMAQTQGPNTFAEAWLTVQNWVSNGPYVLTGWEFRRSMRLEKNPLYWDAHNVRTPVIRLWVVQGFHAVNLYKTGALDFTGENTSIPPPLKDRLRSYRDFHVQPQLSVYFYWLNTRRPPLDNRHFRRALSLAIDRKSIARNVTRGGQSPTANLVPPGMGAYRPGLRVLFDPQRARQELLAAGFSSGEDVAPITITYNAEAANRHIAEAVQQMWRTHLRLTVKLESLEWKAFLARLDEGNFDVGRFGWGAEYPDPLAFLNLLTSSSGDNRARWHHPPYDRLVEVSGRTADPASRDALLEKAENVALDHAPVVPFFVYTRSVMWKPYLEGIWPNALDHHPFKHIAVSPAAARASEAP